MNYERLLELILAWPTLSFIAFIIFIFYFKNKLFIERIKIKDMEIEFKEVTQKIQNQEKELIKQQLRINRMVHYSMSDEMYRFLCAMHAGIEFIFQGDRGFIPRLEYLILNNYIHDLPKLEKYKKGDDIISDIKITKKGYEYLELRQNA